MAELKTKFLEYQQDISEQFSKDDQILQTHIDSIRGVYEDFDISQEQLGQMLTSVYQASVQSMYQLSVSASLTLLAEEKNQEKVDSSISVDASAIKVDTSKICVDTATCALLGKQGDQIDSSISVDTSKICVDQAQCSLMNKQESEIDKTMEVSDETILEIKERVKNITADTTGKDRQTVGFDDNLLLKIVEQQAGLASFAVNANSDTAQDTINDLKCKMNNVEIRVEQITASNPPDSCP